MYQFELEENNQGNVNNNIDLGNPMYAGHIMTI